MTDTIILIHTIFRHGDRTSDREFMYPKDPHIQEEFLPYGPGQLTNIGKKTMYELGKTLRDSYNDFLGDHYMPMYVDAVSTDFDRTKMSLQLVLATLFPPKGDNIWHDTLEWQPIPYTFDKLKDDDILGVIWENKVFLNAYENNFKSEEGVKLLRTYEELITYLKTHTGAEFKTTRDAWSLLGTLVTEVEYGLEVPEWTSSIYPMKLAEFAMNEYRMQTATRELKKLIVGKLMQKILRDTIAKINGKSSCKIHLYSGHDNNVATALIFLGLMFPHFPRYAACIIIEVHKINDKHGMKVKYRSNKLSSFEYLTFPNGSDVLDLIDFENMVQDLFKDETT